jgi:hypothetical protein
VSVYVYYWFRAAFLPVRRGHAFRIVLLTPCFYSFNMSSTGVQMNDGRVESRVENYTKFWKTDPTKEDEADNSKRLDSYTEVVNGEQPAFFFFFFFFFWVL